MQIFISYRRSDCKTIARLIGEQLRGQYGPDSVFQDVTEIEPGADFPEAIRQSIERADIFLALISPDWARDGMSSEADYVRLEVEAAFSNRLEVLPLLVEGGEMPPKETLPSSLQLIARINAITVDSGSDFKAHMERLYQTIEAGKETRLNLDKQHRYILEARRAALSLDRESWSYSADVTGDQYVFMLTLRRYLESTRHLFEIQLALAHSLIRGLKSARRGLDDAIRDVSDDIPVDRYWLRRRLRNETDNMREVHGALLRLMSRNRDLLSLVPNLQQLYDHLSMWVAKYERFRNDDSMCLIFVGVEQHMMFPREVEADIVKAVDALDERLKFH